MVTNQAPPSEPANPAPAAGSNVFQRMSTRLAYCAAAAAVPQTEAALLVPNKVAGAAAGKTVNSAGSRIKPPPPTIASTKPASSDASVTINNSILMIVSFQQQNQTLCFQELLATEIVNLDTPLKLSMDVFRRKKTLGLPAPCCSHTPFGTPDYR